MRLYLCEKPSQAKDIGKVLGATRRGDGFLEGNNIKVTWCVGHLLESAQPEDYDEQYKHWSLQHLPIIPRQWKVTVKPKVSKQFKVVKQLLSQASELVISTDADREGEMIARELIDYCGYKGPVQRLWLSALNDASIRNALSELKPGQQTLPLYHAALSRSRADWLIGINFSRLFTLLGRNAGYDGVLSVGRVQTPTLNLVVMRDREIASFVPHPFWTIGIQLSANGQQFKAVWVAPETATDDAGRCIQLPVAQNAHAAIQTALNATVLKVKTERIKEAAPLLFDLGTLQEVCSRKLGLSVQETLDIAQALYETHKATTYPRSDCGYLPETMLSEVPAVMKAIVQTDPSMAPMAQKLDLSIKSRAWNDKKITAHHGIIPTLEPADLSKMNDKELAVYQLIRSHYLAQFLPHHEYDRMLAQLDCAGQCLEATGKQITVMGWRSVLSVDDAEGNTRSQVLPPLVQGTVCAVQGSKMKSLQTQPPKHFTQGELIKAMKGVAKYVSEPRLKQKLKETTGIGTEATRAGIIEGLLKRGYLETKSKSIRATDAAFTLIDTVPAAITDPGMTALWEQALESIENGQISMETFVAKQGEWITQMVSQYAAAKLSMPAAQGPECPKCPAPMRKRKGKKGEFWSCSTYPQCDGTLPVKPGTKPRKPRTRKTAP